MRSRRRRREERNAQRRGHETPRASDHHASRLGAHGPFRIAGGDLDEGAVRARLADGEKDDGEDAGDVQSADVDDARETLAGGGVGHRAEDHVRHPA